MNILSFIIYEDDDLLIINKPSGLVVNKADTTRELTLQDYLLDYLKIKDLGIGDRAGIVHRLDKDTSGVLLIAKTETAFISLQSQFKDRSIQKEYTALVHDITPEKGVINAPIERNPFNRQRFGVFPGGREAETHYVTQNYYNKNKFSYSLLRVSPKTGRTHQIRVHLKYIHHPIVSDSLYGGRKNLRHDLIFCPRLFLHASYISFTHPTSREHLKFETQLSNELQLVLSSMEIFKS